LIGHPVAGCFPAEKVKSVDLWSFIPAAPEISKSISHPGRIGRIPKGLLMEFWRHWLLVEGWECRGRIIVEQAIVAVESG
jgi:hypothetical protein